MSDTLRNNEVLVDIEITAVSIKTLNDWTFPKIRKMTIKKRNRDMKFETDCCLIIPACSTLDQNNVKCLLHYKVQSPF